MRKLEFSIVHEDLVIAEGYHCYHQLQLIDVVDLELSECEFVGETLLDVTRWVVQRQRIPSADIFKANPGEWLVSDRLRRCLIEKAYTGLDFEEVEILG